MRSKIVFTAGFEGTTSDWHQTSNRGTAVRRRSEKSPGIGQSKGSFMTGIDPEEIKGENTVLGDAENDSTANDGVPREKREHANG